MKHFINDRSGIVTEAIDAAVMLGEGKLARLDGYPGDQGRACAPTGTDRAGRDRLRRRRRPRAGARRLRRRGHADRGGLRRGLRVAQRRRGARRHPRGDRRRPGCLLVVKNYTGDRLNFGLAAERARALGLDVEMVIVADDIALPDAPQAARRRRHALRPQGRRARWPRPGADLATVDGGRRAGRRRHVRSLGMSLDTCTIPGAADGGPHPGAGKAELGLGIHGEPGVEQIALPRRSRARGDDGRRGSRRFVPRRAAARAPPQQSRRRPGASRWRSLTHELGGDRRARPHRPRVRPGGD